MARGDGSCGFMHLRVHNRVHDPLVKRHTRTTFLFRLKAARASKFMRINYAHVRRGPLLATAEARPFVSLSRCQLKKQKRRRKKGKERIPRVSRCRENNGPRCLTVRRVRSRDLMSDAEMPRTGFALSQKLSSRFVKSVAIMMKHHSVFDFDRRGRASC